MFDNPKNWRDLRRIISYMCEGSDIVLDFFAGSCSTDHTVLDLNEADGSALRFIMVQLPEPVDEKSQTGRNALAAGYHTISDLGKARIRKVIDYLKEKRSKGPGESSPSLLEEEGVPASGDLGFRVLRLDTSNIKAWDAKFEDVEGALLSSVENVKPDRSEGDVLYELILKFGLDLAVPMESREIAGKPVHIIGTGALIVCLADEISIDVVEGIAALKDELSPETIRVVFKDAGFADDVVKTNAVQILRQAGIEDVRSL